MRRRSLRCIFVSFLFLLASTSAWSQGVSSGSIIGVVRVLRGTFPEQILVTLQLRGATLSTTYTDPEGRFSFNNLGGAVYHVTINDELYMPVNQEVAVRPEVIATNMLQMTLVPRSKSDPKAPAGSYVTSPADLAKTYPKGAVREFEKGVKSENDGKADEAIERYRKAIKAAPDFAAAHNNLGALYVSKSEFPAAQKELEDSIRLDPSDSKAYFNMANLMLLTGKLQDAERFLQDGFRKNPESPFGMFVQGSVLERSGKLDDAERVLRRALELNPRMTRPHLELVNLYLREKRPADAASELRQFLKNAPTDPLAPRAREVLQKLEASLRTAGR